MALLGVLSRLFSFHRISRAPSTRRNVGGNSHSSESRRKRCPQLDQRRETCPSGNGLPRAPPGQRFFLPRAAFLKAHISDPSDLALRLFERDVLRLSQWVEVDDRQNRGFSVSSAAAHLVDLLLRLDDASLLERCRDVLCEYDRDPAVAWVVEAEHLDIQRACGDSGMINFDLSSSQDNSHPGAALLTWPLRFDECRSYLPLLLATFKERCVPDHMSEAELNLVWKASIDNHPSAADQGLDFLTRRQLSANMARDILFDIIMKKSEKDGEALVHVWDDVHEHERTWRSWQSLRDDFLNKCLKDRHPGFLVKTLREKGLHHLLGCGEYFKLDEILSLENSELSDHGIVRISAEVYFAISQLYEHEKDAIARALATSDDLDSWERTMLAGIAVEQQGSSSCPTSQQQDLSRRAEQSTAAESSLAHTNSHISPRSEMAIGNLPISQGVPGSVQSNSSFSASTEKEVHLPRNFVPELEPSAVSSRHHSPPCLSDDSKSRKSSPRTSTTGLLLSESEEQLSHPTLTSDLNDVRDSVSKSTVGTYQARQVTSIPSLLESFLVEAFGLPYSMFGIH